MSSRQTTPPGVSSPPSRLMQPLRAIERYVRTEVSSSKLLLLATALALIWANSPLAASYFGLWETHLSIQLANWGLDYSLHHWVNDGLMAVFFLVVGLEIKRELLLGELRSPRQAALPIIAAVGGMVVPALLYLVFNAGGESSHGWGIPMATDIAFALAVLTALGSRVPFALKIFLTALAIVDDLGAVLVIALFYTSGINFQALWISLLLLGLLVLINVVGIHALWPYIIVGFFVWLAMLQSGVHATVAGVLVAMTVPARNRFNLEAYVETTREQLDEMEQSGEDEEADRQLTLEQIESASEERESPLQRLVHKLEWPVAFLIVPLFALANAGVSFGGEAAPRIDSVSIGVFFGLVLGKQIGIFLASWLAVRSGLAALPNDSTWRQLYGVAILGGIGFTMSLFVSELAFDTEQELASAKLGIFIGSAAATALGWFVISSLNRARTSTPSDGV
jgi:NhaA family Na+:H+ antiporter